MVQKFEFRNENHSLKIIFRLLKQKIFFEVEIQKGKKQQFSATKII